MRFTRECITAQGGVAIYSKKRLPSSAANVTGVGTTAWQNVGFIYNSDGGYSTVSTSFNKTTNYLRSKWHHFGIPEAATVVGILVEIERKRSDTPGGSVTDNSIKLVKADGVSYSTTDMSVGANWSITEGISSFGGSTSLWGETWTYSTINDIDFGAILSANIVGGADPDNQCVASVDTIALTVYYTWEEAYYTLTIADPDGIGMTYWVNGDVDVDLYAESGVFPDPVYNIRLYAINYTTATITLTNAPYTEIYTVTNAATGWITIPADCTLTLSYSGE